MSGQEKQIKAIEAQIAQLQKQLISIKRAENSLWNAIYEKCRELRISARNAKTLSNFFSEIISSWAQDQGNKFNNAYKGSASAPGFVDCLNRLISAVESPDPEVSFDLVSSLPFGAKDNSPRDEIPETIVSPPPLEGAPQTETMRVPDEKFNSFSRRVNIPKPFTEGS